MDKEYFGRVLGYKSAMAQARVMLTDGIITEEEYAIIDGETFLKGEPAEIGIRKLS